jgi:hypothetical protein
MDRTTKSALIGAGGAIAAAVVAGIFGLFDGKAPSSSHPSESEPRTERSSKELATRPQDSAGTLPNSGQRAPYERVANVSLHETFVDPETGFVFSVDEITKGFFARGIPVTTKYTLPNGRSYYGGRRIGFTVDFEARGRTFFAVIEGVDYERNQVRIRVRSR